jgi:hypothetical protein
MVEYHRKINRINSKLAAIVQGNVNEKRAVPRETTAIMPMVTGRTSSSDGIRRIVAKTLLSLH